MNSPWRTEILAVLRKEFQSESRSRSGVLTAALFSLTTVVAIAFASFSRTLTGTFAAGLLAVALLFGSVVALPRTFLVEEELGTGDLLRLTARPHAVFWGKALFNFANTLLTALVLAVLFVVLVRVNVTNPLLLVMSLIGASASFAAGVTLSGALVAQAANRTTLAAATALPLLLPLVALCVSALRVALGDGLPEGGVSAAIGLIAYGVLSFSIGPYLFAAVWKS